MKISLGLAAIILLAAAPAHGQSRGGASHTPGNGGGGSFGGGALSGISNFTTLGWTPPADLASTNVSGSDATFLPSTFVTFSVAVAQGNANLNEQAKTVVQAAAESRKAAKAQAKIVVMQDDRGNVVFRQN